MLHQELHEFLSIDESHHQHFPDQEPSIEEWRLLRKHFASAEHKESILESHSRYMSIFVRDPHVVTK